MKKLLIIFLMFSITWAKAQEGIMLMPMPKEVAFSELKYRIDESFSVKIEGPEDRLVEEYAFRFLSRVSNRTGIFLNDYFPSEDSIKYNLVISLSEVVQLELGVDESYQLIVSDSSLVLNAKTNIGVYRGLETLYQLISADSKGYYFSGIDVTDEPRFVWRGLLLDVCRHWLPLEVVLRNLDAMAAVKLNVLHLHLTEDQGFRVESKVYPKLHELGSDGNYYSQEDIVKIVNYAKERGIRVVPEFDIPGHATSWFVGYPELASSPGPYSLTRTWGVQDPTMDPTKDSTYIFLNNFLTEMSELFPDEYIHIGGDENNGKQWDANPEIISFKEENNLESNHELQAYFNVKVAEILTSLNKRMVGWDEIQDPDLPKSIVIQSWRGKQGLIDAAESGYDVILSNGYYIDLVQPASYHYLVDPMPADTSITDEAREHVLGGEATMWSERISTETVDGRIWPRTAAIAERFWSPSTINDVDDMYLRMENISIQLEEHGLLHLKNYEMMMRRLVGQENVATLKTLADLLEPIEGYARNGYKNYTMFSPLTRVPDIAKPDALEARKFTLLVKEYLEDEGLNEKNDLKHYLLHWVENHKGFKLLVAEYPELREVLPHSETLSKLAILGMQSLSANKFHDEAWKASAKSMLEEAKKPKGECELKVVEAISLLVEATY